MNKNITLHLHNERGKKKGKTTTKKTKMLICSDHIFTVFTTFWQEFTLLMFGLRQNCKKAHVCDFHLISIFMPNRKYLYKLLLLLGSKY